MTENTIIAQIEKSETERTIISLSHFRGQSYVDIRTWWMPPAADDYVPTRKGVSISAEYLGEIVQCLQTLEADLAFLESRRQVA